MSKVKKGNDMQQPQAKNFVTQVLATIDSSNFDELAQSFNPNCVYEHRGYEPLQDLEQLEHFYRVDRIIAKSTCFFRPAI